MGKLAESLAVVPASNTCRINEIFLQLDTLDQRAFIAACDKIRKASPRDRSSRRYPFTEMWLIKALRAEGHTVSKDSLSRHMRQECSCEFA